VEKIRLIHKAGLVYYYYQFVYKLVYYNNKSRNTPVHRFPGLRRFLETVFAKKLENLDRC